MLASKYFFSCIRVMMVGCGGGFDFVHSMMLYPELKRLGKKVVLTSFSFGNVDNIESKWTCISPFSGQMLRLYGQNKLLRQSWPLPSPYQTRTMALKLALLPS